MSGPSAFVEGMGAVSNLGADWTSTWTQLLTGKTRVSPFEARSRRFAVDVPVAIVHGADRSLRGAVGPTARFARAALREACQHNFASMQVYGSTNHGESDIVVDVHDAEKDGGSASLSTELWHSFLLDPLPDNITPSRPVTWVQSACTSGLHALLFATLDLVSSSRAHRVAALASDAISLPGVVGFARSGASTKTTCRPFHQHRDGLLIGEGAACLVLSSSAESGNHGIRVLGWGMSCDAGHPTHPDESGKHLERCIRDALSRAGIEASAVQAGILHGTGTKANDRIECDVVSRIWQERPLAATSLKGSLGHTMSAAGLFNALAAVQALRDGVLPPTHTDGSELLPGLDFVCGSPREIDRSGAMLVTASGFGGNNVAIIFARR